jgi:hypothetical protein
LLHGTGSGQRGWCPTRYLFSMKMSAKQTPRTYEKATYLLQFFCYPNPTTIVLKDCTITTTVPKRMQFYYLRFD